MANIIRFDPFREMLSLREAVNQLFEQSFVQPTSLLRSSMMSVPMDVYETEQGYQIKALLPGVNADDIELTVRQNTLTLKGQFPATVESEKSVNWLIHEIGSVAFERSITFDKPIDADHITTEYSQGVLSIFVPISEANRPKRISVKTAAPKELVSEAH
jgi:HSP20 family protein